MLCGVLCCFGGSQARGLMRRHLVVLLLLLQQGRKELPVVLALAALTVGGA